MSIRKYRNMIAAYDGHNGPVTIEAVQSFICAELKQRLTGREYGLVMSAVNRAFRAGKASMGAEVVDDEYVWIDCLGRLFPLETLSNLPDGDDAANIEDGPPDEFWADILLADGPDDYDPEEAFSHYLHPEEYEKLRKGGLRHAG